ncbi:hypothetical protein [Motilimonas pumila]|uniref:Exo-alpha-sialidase n=1 Tax=Motilimonas pumila TaxID=2303987 RepID=A0A418YDV6_9GAMM|nr:hypothetical protein [Motilimonas pumila]RJG42711.1 hypothetical protein D1Z90_11505 [Motilimonas pumila]
MKVKFLVLLFWFFKFFLTFFTAKPSAYKNRKFYFLTSDKFFIVGFFYLKSFRLETILGCSEFSSLDFRALFPINNEKLLLSIKGFDSGDYGRTYLVDIKSNSSTLVLPYCVWGVDSHNGDLFCGVYHEINEPGGVCKVFSSEDFGRTWHDITPQQWLGQNHVHNLRVDVERNLLVANLGDVDAFSGAWVLPLQFLEGNDRSITREKWVNTFCEISIGTQFIGYARIGNKAFLSDDTGPRKNPARNGVYSVDYSTGGFVPAFIIEPDFGWGCFFLEPFWGGLLVAVRPIKGKGGLFYSSCGNKWHCLLSIPEMNVKDWRSNRVLAYFPRML